MRTKALKPIIYLAIFAISGLVVMYLWNSIIPSVIGWTELNYLQSLGMIVLSRLLFGGFGGIKHKSEHRKIRDELKEMSKEQKREYIREYMNKRSKNVEK